jgi:hypothetical protein
VSPASPRRKPPRTPPAETWDLKAASAAAEREWKAAAQAEPEIMAALRERLKNRPLDRSDNPNRTHRLKGKLPQWQHEITSGGRVWYCPDSEARIVWVTRVSLDPPRETH